MIKVIGKATALAFAILTMQPALAYKYVTSGNSNGGAHHGEQGDEVLQDTRSASCAPATGLRNLEWNNVKALIETGGSMWQDRANSRAAYIVPKEGNVSSIYAGALWMGGISPDQQLKLAAVTFRADGNDFWPGPLTNDGTASVTPQVCTQYDRFFVSLRQDSQRQRQFFDCDEAGEDDCIENYAIPSYFFDYPALGNTAAGQDLYLAPFYDYDGDMFYNPQEGDYPWYDFLREINCFERRREDPVPLFGDQTFYWIFNDKGNAHTESQGQPIGMEVRAQAFAFTSNDEVNNMTFYNYVLINQGSQTLTNTYFGSWVDADLGTSVDDYVGCDVQRGLGYCYNGDSFDEPTTSSPGYGSNPPAVGVDFFEGPYQDEDEFDNPLTTDIIDADDSLGIPYKGLGIGYGDGVIDNERFGMRRFVYYVNNPGNPIFGDPTVAIHYYNFMRGFWKNGARMKYGGNGVSGPGVLQNVDADYMFPGSTDPVAWGTRGVVVPAWNEVTAGNVPGDRRFIQAAGPFTLSPGDYNNITVGVVWARANGGTPSESVDLLREFDDKAQALFDNCFELVSGPDAPDVTVREMSREVILMLSNDNPISTNYQENYGPDQGGFDPSIPEELSDGTQLTDEQRSYKFEGYLVYQLANAEVNPADLDDIGKARLIAQCDVRNEISNIINYSRDPDTEMIVPELMVDASNEGIRRSFRVTTDAFAQGNNRLVNHKTYYFMVIAYGYNNYQEYDVAQERGQDEAFLASRKGAIGAIPVIAAIPHDVKPENGGTTANASYGTGVFLTRIEGKGNGLNDLIITAESENDILAN
ncbi:MAG: T9SS C-terminal target domain-containing protein, partial [Flavobacteriales bacterium]